MDGDALTLPVVMKENECDVIPVTPSLNVAVKLTLLALVVADVVRLKESM